MFRRCGFFLVLVAPISILPHLARLAEAGEKVPVTADKKNVPVCLLTGFEPFGGDDKNASWEAIKDFEGQTVAGWRIAVARLPVVYDEVEAPLLAAIRKHKPAIVLSFGVGKESVTIEYYARNEYSSSKLEDNRGNLPPREKLVPGGKEGYENELPNASILRALEKARMGAVESRDAGGYLCNECFYRLMLLDSRKSMGFEIQRRGFVHLPDFGTADREGGTYTPEKLQHAVRIVIEQTALDVERKEPKPERR